MLYLSLHSSLRDAAIKGERDGFKNISPHILFGLTKILRVGKEREIKSSKFNADFVKIYWSNINDCTE